MTLVLRQNQLPNFTLHACSASSCGQGASVRIKVQANVTVTIACTNGSHMACVETSSDDSKVM